MIEETNELTYIVYRYVTPNNEIYIGVTHNPKRRWFPSLYKGCSLEPYIDKYGWDAISKEVVASGLTREEALKLEDSLIVDARNNGTRVINRYRSGHHSQSLERKEEHKATSTAWNKAHPERCKANRREYYKRKKAEKHAKQSVEEKVKPTKSKSKHKRPLF